MGIASHNPEATRSPTFPGGQAAREPPRKSAAVPCGIESEGDMKDPGTRRRDFIKASAVAAAGVVLVKPGSVFGSPASDAIALGIIGCGGRGNAVAGDLVKAGARVVALHDLFDDRLAETRDRFDKLAAEKGLP